MKKYKWKHPMSEETKQKMSASLKIIWKKRKAHLAELEAFKALYGEGNG